MEVSIIDEVIDISNLENPKLAKGHLRIKNTGPTAQTIGKLGGCFIHELRNLESDTPDLEIYSGIAACFSSMGSGDSTLTLKPQEVFEQDFKISYGGKELKSKPNQFRVGVNIPGYGLVWGTPITVTIKGDVEKWARHADFLKRLKEQSQSKHPDGLSKTFDENGKIYEEATYKDGKLNGPSKRYFKSGGIEEEVDYKNNEIQHERRYFKNGKLQADITYEKGNMTSYTTNHEDGSLEEHASTIHGSLCLEDDSPTRLEGAVAKRCRSLRH
ncbi:MAG: toxin-antitoxin system YwqK family antitoxin [Pseudobdellovibrionaceae bacterium]